MKPLGLVLLVDDDDITNQVNYRTLKKSQLVQDIKIFTDGTQAMEYMLSSVCNPLTPGTEPCPEVIFLDIKMPVMDGFKFLDAYEAAGFKQTASTKIFMLTSSASFYDLNRLEQYADVKRHYPKPLSKQDIKEVIHDYFPQLSE